MRPLRATWSRFWSVFRARKLNHDLDDELNAHLDLHISGAEACCVWPLRLPWSSARRDPSRVPGSEPVGVPGSAAPPWSSPA